MLGDHNQLSNIVTYSLESTIVTVLSPQKQRYRLQTLVSEKDDESERRRIVVADRRDGKGRQRPFYGPGGLSFSRGFELTR